MLLIQAQITELRLSGAIASPSWWCYDDDE